MKNVIIRLTESELKSIIKESVKRILKEDDEIKAKHFGRDKYYVNSLPKRGSVRAGTDDEFEHGGYTTIGPDEFEHLADTYDENLGDEYIPGNEEPVGYDPLEGIFYDTGEYVPRDRELQSDYAKYRHKVGDYGSMRRKHEMERDWNSLKTNYPDWKDSLNAPDSNFNVQDTKGSWGMLAQDDPETFGGKLARNFNGQNLLGAVNKSLK